MIETLEDYSEYNDHCKEQLEKYARYLKDNCKDCEGCQFEVVDGEETHCRINGLLPCDWEV